MNRGEPNSNAAQPVSLDGVLQTPSDAISGSVAKLLDNVICATHTADAETALLDESVRQLAQVVRQSGQTELTLRGLEQLVQIALQDYVRDVGLNSISAGQLVAKISYTLFEDPASRDRLERLWANLAETRS